MNVYTLTNLHSLMMKATEESLSCPEPGAMEAFCAVIKETAEGPQLAAQLLATRMHSSNPKEALLALTMLDRCMSRSSPNFHSEVGKFRFLNEMIKLVSPKYFADRTAPEVQTRVLQLLHAWSIEYPKEAKFKVAYDMLKNQGVVKETPPPLPPEDAPSPCQNKPRDTVFEDEEKSKLLKKLLQSKRPEDLQHANRLIKTMVREEERRSEANSRKTQEVSAALDSAGLLGDMLDHASETSADEEQLIHELHGSCLRMRPVLHRLAASETQTDHLEDILRASDVLDEVLARYNTYLVERKVKADEPKPDPNASQSDTLLDIAVSNVLKKDSEAINVLKTNSIDDLGDILSAEVGPSSASIAEPLKPVSLIPCDDAIILEDKDSKQESWNELDSLGKQLLQQSLPDNARRADGFSNKALKKIPMNALEKSSPKHASELKNGAILDLDFFTQPKVERSTSTQYKPVTCKDDDLMVDISGNLATTVTISPLLNNNSEQITNNRPLDNIVNQSLPTQNSSECDNAHDTVDNTENAASAPGINFTKTSYSNDVKPLTDINVTLDDIKPSKIPPLVAFEEDRGVTVVFHFCKDKPRPDVNVIVVSTTSKNSSAIEDYKFQSVVPKGCKVRLLTPSGTCLPPYNPFLPPPALTQVMLIARPSSSPPVNLKFVITFTCDEEMCSEMGEVNHLPLDDI